MHFLSFTWNPIEGIDLGFFMIRFYSLSYVIAFIVGWFIMKRFFKNETYPWKNWIVYLSIWWLPFW